MMPAGPQSKPLSVPCVPVGIWVAFKFETETVTRKELAAWESALRANRRGCGACRHLEGLDLARHALRRTHTTAAASLNKA